MADQYLNQIVFGDCRETLRDMAARGVKAQTIVTSPPYYALRDYGDPRQIGLEDTPDEYIANLVAVFRDARELRNDDGTLWINIGDSYAGNGAAYYDEKSTLRGTKQAARMGAKRKVKRGPGLKSKDLIGIPWMLAFALRADGWYLRQDIVWNKSNGMPESVSDRCTKVHEYIFLLSKKPRYFFDADAICEAAASNEGCDGNATRNKRSVWTVATQPYGGEHLAPFPAALITPCVLAGSRPGDIVLDPFMGSGTTAEVALRLGRKFIGCELNREYESLQKERISNATRQGDMFYLARTAFCAST